MRWNVCILASSPLDGDAYTALLRSLSWYAEWLPLTQVPLWVSVRAQSEAVVVVPRQLTLKTVPLVGQATDVFGATRVLAILDSPADPFLPALLKLELGGVFFRDQTAAELSAALCLVTERKQYRPEVLSAPAPAPAAEAGLPHLSVREAQIMDLLVQGVTLREAAAQMQISYKTADQHRTAVFRKLGVANRVQLTRLAARLDLLDR